MTTSATTVSVSFGIETNNAEAGPSTLPIDIQPFPPIQISIEAEEGRSPFESVHSNVSIVSSHPNGGTVTALPQEHKQVFENLDITTGYFDSKLIINDDQKYIYTQSNVAPILPKITEKISINISGGPLGTVQTLPQRWEATEVHIISHGESPALDFLGTGGQVTYTLANHGNLVADGSNPIFNELFDTPGTYSWTCPAGVSSVSVVCVGAGGSGGWQWSSGGGGGGGLGWKNNISVTAGQSYTVVVGDHGGEVANAYNATTGIGGNSYFISTSTVCGFGAGGGGLDYAGNTKSTGHGAHGGGYAGDGGGAGGNGAVGGSWTHGGGGAGGYSGDGASRNTNTSASGGGGGAGQYYSSTYGVGAGGGVGVHGEGTSGTTFADGTGYGGKGGSGGGDGMAGESSERSSSNIWTRSALDTTTVRNTIVGGQYGGGGGGSGTTRGGGPGGTGAVKLVYKTSGSATLEFPSTNVAEVASPETSTTQVTDPQPVFSYSSFPSNLGIERILTNKSITTSATTAVIPSNLPTNQLENISFNTIQPQNSTISYPNGGVTIQTHGTTRPPIINDINNLSVTTNPLGFLDVMPTTVPTINTTLKFDPSFPKSIDVSKDVTFGAPSYCNSVSQTILIANEEPLGFFTEDGISFFAELTDQNDPRLTTGTSSGGEGGGGDEGDGSGTGPVQTWN